MYLYGGDYHPEQWPDAVRSEDLELMRQANVNLVTVGVFGWSLLQPAPRRYEVAWLDRILDDLGGAGIGVALATPTAAPPPWFTLAHPDALTQTREGVRLVHGSRDTYCVNAPAYRSACRDIASRLAWRYAAHPAVRLWHVHNEYGTWCFCDCCAAAFRLWLIRRYGSLTDLNEAWTTAFWSQRYGRWEEILPPRATQYLTNPAQELDYRRFLSDSMLAAFCEQRDVIRASASTARITTNFVLGSWVPVDHARWAAEVDLVAIDCYPSALDDLLAESAFAADAARGWAGGSSWLLMEHAPREGQLMTSIALSHIARGSEGALFFQWRAGRGGAEQWHPALVPHNGPDSVRFRQTVTLGNRLAELSRSPAVEAVETVRADVAIWYDEQCDWALQATHHLPVTIDYRAEVRRCHTLLERLGYPVDVVPPHAELDRYRLLLVPSAYMLTDDAVAALEAFAGTLVISNWSGVVDGCLRVRSPRPFRGEELTADLIERACDLTGVSKVVADDVRSGSVAIRSRGGLWLFARDGEAEFRPDEPT